MAKKRKTETEHEMLGTNIPENKKLSLSKCRKILEANGDRKYTDEQISQIRDVLYNLVKVDYEITMTKKDRFKPSQTGNG